MDEPVTVTLRLEHPQQVDLLHRTVWAAMQAAEAQGDDATSRRLAPIHDRLHDLQAAAG